MQVRVWLPPLLCDGADAEEIVGNGETLHDLLAGLGQVGRRVMMSTFDDTRALTIYLNGAAVLRWDAELKDGDEVVIVPPIRGGR